MLQHCPMLYSFPPSDGLILSHIGEAFQVNASEISHVCDEKARLLRGYSFALSDYERVSRLLDERTGVMSKADYDGIHSFAEKAKELVEQARSIEAGLRLSYRTQYDEGNIGQLYRRQDEIGTPFCLTFDYDSLTDHAVTVRERDTMRQERIGTDRLEEYLREKL